MCTFTSHNNSKKQVYIKEKLGILSSIRDHRKSRETREVTYICRYTSKHLIPNLVTVFKSNLKFLIIPYTCTIGFDLRHYLRLVLRSFLGGVVILAISGLVEDLTWQKSMVHVLVDGLIWLARHFLCQFTAYQPLRSQDSPVIPCLDFNCGLPPF